MADNNQQGDQQKAATPGENTTPPGTPPEGNNGGAQNPPPDETKVEISEKELADLKTKAGRWDKRHESGKGKPKQKRSWEKSGDGDGDGSGEPLEVREAREEAQAAKREAFGLKLEKQVGKVLESDEYKNLSPQVKRLIARNPAAYIDPRSETVEDAILDIQDFLDEELDNLTDQSGGTTPAPKTETPVTPPASSSRSTNTSSSAEEESVEGKTGAARSTAILRNLARRGKVQL